MMEGFTTVFLQPWPSRALVEPLWAVYDWVMSPSNGLKQPVPAGRFSLCRS